MILSRKGYLDSGLFPALKTPMLLLGILIILLGVFIWGYAFFHSRIDEGIKNNHLVTDGKKSWEGSAAMLAVSFLLGFTMLVFAQGLSIPKALLLAVLGALAGTVTELFTSSEYDTITVPFAIEAVLLLLNTLQ